MSQGPDDSLPQAGFGFGHDGEGMLPHESMGLAKTGVSWYGALLRDVTVEDGLERHNQVEGWSEGGKVVMMMGWMTVRVYPEQQPGGEHPKWGAEGHYSGHLGGKIPTLNCALACRGPWHEKQMHKMA